MFLQNSQGPPPPYPNQQQSVNNGAYPTKRFKPGEEPINGQAPVRAPQGLSQQQLQMLQYLQQNQANLTSHQQTIFQQLTHQYRLMQQHQQQLRLQQQRTQQPQVQVNSVATRPAGQQFQGQPGFQQQQATRQPIVSFFLLHFF